MNITERIYHERGFPVEVVMINGSSVVHKIFLPYCLRIDFILYSREYGVDPEQVPMVENSKNDKIIRIHANIMRMPRIN